jgi:Flp pilus assembly protein CpaB
MVLAGVLGALLTLSALRAADNTRAVLVAVHDIAPGSVIDSHALRVTRVHVDDKVLATLFDATALPSLRGRIAVEQVQSGSLLNRDAVRSVMAGGAPRAMSFPIARSRAVGGALVVGDRVDVLSVLRTSGRSSYVATDVQVLAFSGRSSGPLQGSDDASVTLAIDSDSAARIASALETGSITLIRATGSTPLPPVGSAAPAVAGVASGTGLP